MPSDPSYVAVVDDEDSLRETLSIALTRDGYLCEGFRTGTEAWASFQHRWPEVVVLDVSMPGIDGLELCRRLRQRDELLPIVFLSSRDEEVDRILGLELGGDDYVTKPFSVRELLVRIKVLRRRAFRSPVEPPRSPDPLWLDEEGYTVRWKQSRVDLTVTEFRIVACLFRRPGQVKTRDQLMSSAYPETTFVDPRTIDTHIKRIRRKFEAIDPQFTAIAAVAGLGYRGDLT